MSNVAEVLYVAKSRRSGCWEAGSARRRDGHVDVTHSTPAGVGLDADPEQMFAAGWSAVSDGAMTLAALKVKVVLSDTSTIDATVNLCLVDGGYFLQARLNAGVADMPPELARLVAAVSACGAARRKGIRGEIDVTIERI